jgi:hypothetical protein
MRVILLALCFLSGCSFLGPDVERSFALCLQYDRDATYTIGRDLKKVECRR